MASSKELQQPARSLTHRPSLSNTASAAGFGTTNTPSNPLTNRQPHSRATSHSIIGAALNVNHRVSRRKSMTNPGPNVAAVAALMQDVEGVRRNAASKVGAVTIGSLPRQTSAMAAAMAAASAAHGSIGGAALPSPPASLPTGKFMTTDGSAIDDANDMSDGEIDLAQQGDAMSGASAFDIARIRRASDGQPLMKEGRRSINRNELRCDKCGKGYKHSSCLTKHLWEHTPEWSLTSKLLISKHQQVQLLEAASVLVAMNNNHPSENDIGATTPPDSARDFGSEQGSASPAASGFSDQNDDRRSVDTTPPPSHAEGGMNVDIPVKQEAPVMLSPPPLERRSFSQRAANGTGASGAARSFQSALPTGAFGLVHERQGSQDNLRPSSSGKNTTGQEDSDLAAAVGLLSCSFNSNGDSHPAVVGSAHSLAQGVPPVPPVPVQYLGQTPTPLDDTSFINSFPTRAPESFTRGERHRGSLVEDVRMEDSGDSAMGDDDDDMRSRARSDDDDDGVFGRMED